MHYQKMINGITVGENDCLNFFYDNYCSKIYGIAYNITHSEKFAEDILSEVFLYLVKNIHKHSFSNQEEMDQWIGKLSCGFALIKLRKQKINYSHIITKHEVV